MSSAESVQRYPFDHRMNNTSTNIKVLGHEKSAIRDSINLTKPVSPVSDSPI